MRGNRIIILLKVSVTDLSLAFGPCLRHQWPVVHKLGNHPVVRVMVPSTNMAVWAYTPVLLVCRSACSHSAPAIISLQWRRRLCHRVDLSFSVCVCVWTGCL